MTAVHGPAFSDLLRHYRDAAGLTQEELAERARMSAQAVSQLERGARQRPQRGTVLLLVEALGLQGPERNAFESAARRAGMTSAPPSPAGQDDGSPPTNLPLQPTPFLGRERELSALRERLLRPDVRLLSLLGTGGTGKTRLALQLASNALDAFPSGVFFVGLAPLSDPALVLSAIAQELGVHEGANRPLLDSLKDYLHDKLLLLVLDNFEHLVDAASVVAALLAAAPRLKVLVTSRVVLRLSGEHEVWVPPLALPDPQHLPPLEDLLHYDAVRLFITRAQAVKADFTLTAENAPVVAAICHRLDGLPLAIELAMARLRLFSPQALLARLEHRLALLVGGARDLPTRQQTLANTIAWSYDLLEPTEQVLFRRLGVFQGGGTLEAMAAVCAASGEPDLPVLETVESLVAKSLLLQDAQPDGEPRFRMLETIREFALEQLQRHGEVEALRQRHLDYYLGWAVEACSHVQRAEQLEWDARLDQEEDNFRAVFDWCVQRGQKSDPQATEEGLQLAGTLGYWYWPQHDRYSEGLGWLERLFELPGAAARTTGRGRALLGAGLLSLFSGWFPRGGHTPAWTLYEEALAIGQELGDKGICAMACLGLANALPDPGAFVAYCEEGLRLYREVDDAWGVAFALWLLGGGYVATGDLDTAQTLLKRSLAVNTAIGERWNMAGANAGLAQVAAAAGDPETARMLLEQALHLCHELGYQMGIGDNNAKLGHVALQVGDRAAACEYYCQALASFLDSGYFAHSALALTGLASVALDDGAPVQAMCLAGAATHLSGDNSSILAANAPWVEVSAALQIRDAVRQILSEEEAAHAWAEGQAMTLEQAIAYALAENGKPAAARDEGVRSPMSPRQDGQP